MSLPHLIICERTSRWATALRRELPPGIRIAQVRGLASCAGELAAAPASLLAVEVTRANFADALAFGSEVGRHYPRAALAFMTDHDLRPLRWLLHEAGAACVAVSPRELADFAPFAANHFARQPQARTNFAASVWAELPWANAATV
jgi:hypothetical protein